jgi:hypothetical protein
MKREIRFRAPEKAIARAPPILERYLANGR